MIEKLRRWGMVQVLPAMAFMMPPSEVVSPSPRELPVEIQAHLVDDVRIKSLRHYDADVEAEQEKRFDFRPLGHTINADGTVQVRGEFLLSEKTGVHPHWKNRRGLRAQRQRLERAGALWRRREGGCAFTRW